MKCLALEDSVRNRLFDTVKNSVFVYTVSLNSSDFTIGLLFISLAFKNLNHGWN